MRIGNRIFPYPVLNSMRSISDYGQNEFNLSFDLDDDGNFFIEDNMFILKNTCIKTNSQYLKSLISNNLAQAVCVIECSQTVFRKIIDISLIPKDININMEYLSGKVSVSCYVYVTKDKLAYNSNEFSELFHGYVFELEKFDIIAVDDGYQFNILKDLDLLNKVSSIFIVAKRHDDSKSLTYEMKRENIVIHLPSEAYDKYYAMRNNDNSQYILFSIILIPVLVVCIENIKKDSVNYEDIYDLSQNFIWLNSIINRYKHVNHEEMTIETLNEIDSFELSQLLLDYTNNIAINDFYNFINMKFDESEDNYE
ncbi:MAG TPA: hypothetical protein DHS57_05760 [Erysipelotrichaceae bacterium]|nr:hypothetical protein [Erysipelotrichaceae bacterium]HCY06764.1 hypothetical protein [Erysipelotrichaceae bacterium]